MSEKHDEILIEIAIEEREQGIETQLRIICIALIAAKQKRTFRSICFKKDPFNSFLMFLGPGLHRIALKEQCKVKFQSLLLLLLFTIL